MNAAVERVLALARKKLEHSDVQVELKLAPDLPRVQGAADQIAQVFLNLIVNAAEAMSDGGRLRIESRADATHVQVTFADTGPGIAPEDLPHIFEPFYTTKDSGTGLGLAVSYSIIESHGGTLSVDSVPGHGATFTVRLQAATAPEAAPTKRRKKLERETQSVKSKAWSAVHGATRNRRYAIRRTRCCKEPGCSSWTTKRRCGFRCPKSLRLRGAQVTTAADGREAVELLNEHDFDLMLLDLKMPGMSGMQVLEVAQKVRPGTVVILLTAHATLDSAIARCGAERIDYLLKPCEPRALIAGVERGLTKRGEFLRRQSLVGLMEQTVSALKTDPTASPVPTPPPPGSEDLLRAADLTIDLKKRLALMGDQTLTLSPTEFNVLAHFVRNPDRAITCSELVREGLGYECYRAGSAACDPRPHSPVATKDRGQPGRAEKAGDGSRGGVYAGDGDVERGDVKRRAATQSVPPFFYPLPSSPGKTLVMTRITVSRISTTTITQEMMLNTRPLTNLPISRLSLMSRSITTRMTGRSTPLSVWLASMACTSDLIGSKMMPAPKTMSVV